MRDDGFGDWRIQVVTTITKDVPAAYPGGPSHKAGAPVYLVTPALDATGRMVSFTTPSPVAMALSIAHEAARQARKLRPTIAFTDVVTPRGPGRNVATENLPHLYDYFQYCMITVTFCFQAIEAFCNQSIADKLTGTFKLKRKKGHIGANAEKLQRIASTEEKLGDVVPLILGVSSPKGTAVWDEFLSLKHARGSTVHLKRDEVQPKGLGRHSLFHEFFNQEVDRYVRATLNIIQLLLDPAKPPRWFVLAKAMMGGADRR